MAVLMMDIDEISYLEGISDTRRRQMLDDAIAHAVKAAPCLAEDLSDQTIAWVKSIIRGAVERWHDSRSMVDSETTGPYSRNRQLGFIPRRTGMFTDSELADLRALCGESGGAVPLHNMPAGRGDYDRLFAQPPQVRR